MAAPVRGPAPRPVRLAVAATTAANETNLNGSWHPRARPSYPQTSGKEPVVHPACHSARSDGPTCRREWADRGENSEPGETLPRKGANERRTWLPDGRG